MNILNVYATRFYNRKAGNIIGSLLLLLENVTSPAVGCTPDPAGGWGAGGPVGSAVCGIHLTRWILNPLETIQACA